MPTLIPLLVQYIEKEVLERYDTESDSAPTFPDEYVVSDLGSDLITSSL